MHSKDWRLVLKKTLFHPKADLVERIRFQIKIQHYRLQEKTIIYVDESGFANDSPRTHGYSLKGERCYGEKDWHSRGRINAIGAIINFTFLTVCLFNDNINSDVFFAWLKEDLLLKAPPESVIVLDNATFHKRDNMREAIRDYGHIPEYLPPYSPDLNPIEHKWAQFKTTRRQKRFSAHETFSFYPFLCCIMIL